MSLIIGITGKKVAGKGTVSDYLIKNFSAKHYRFSKILEDIADRLYLPKTRENEIDIALSLREKFGNEIFAHVLKKDIEKSSDEISIIDGIRYWEEYNILSNLENFYLIAISAPLESRYERALQRGEKEDEKSMSFTDFKKQELAPTEITIEELCKKADFKIANDTSFENLYTAIQKIMQKLKK